MIIATLVRWLRPPIATTGTTEPADLLTGLHLARRAILVAAPVIAEVGYMLYAQPAGRDGRGRRVLRKWW